MTIVGSIARNSSAPCSLTIAICTHNNAAMLNRLLEGLGRQSVSSSVAWETIVVDNNSTPDTHAAVHEHIRLGRIPGLRCVREEQQGLTYARVRAVNESVSSLIAFIDDDCLPEHDWVEEAVRFFALHPNAGALGGRVCLSWERAPEEIVERYAASYAHQDYGDSLRRMASEGITHLVGAGLVVRREALYASGWLDDRLLVDRQGGHLTAGGDTEMVLRIRKAGYELWYSPALRITHFIPSGRMSVDYLCRLHRGFGRSEPLLGLLALHARESAWLWRLRAFVSYMKCFARRALLALGRLVQRSRITDEERIALYRAVGRVEGSITLLLSRHRL